MKKEEKKPVYIQCPRCELNYITKKDKLCPVCKAEMGLLDASILIPDEEDGERICPVCKVNILADDEDICFVCHKEKHKEADPEGEEWTDFSDDEDTIDDETDIPITISLEEEAESEEEEEEFDEQYTEPDDFDYDVDPDDFEDDEEEALDDDED